MAEPTAYRVLYLIVCASPRARHVAELVSRAQGRGWTVCVIPTPQAQKFIDRPALEQKTGFPVRSEYEQAATADTLPPPDAMLVCPATFNTLNKWAYGLADTLALALLTEAIGLRLPLVAAPALNSAQAGHPAFERSVGALREMGVAVLYGPVWETAPHQMRGRYLHLGYLLDAQVKVGAWSDAETTMRQIATMVNDVASIRMVVLLARILPELTYEHVPGSTREIAEQLALLLRQAST